MTSEAAFIAALRAIAVAPAARGLADDAAVLGLGDTRLVLTMDAIVEGVHFLPEDPAETVAWKLVATNVSDLSAKGAVPKGCLLSYPLAEDDEWNDAFLRGLARACQAFELPLLGGDTVRQPAGSARSFSLVALGEPMRGVAVPSRAGAKVGDVLWLSGSIGDSGLGLSILQGRHSANPTDREKLVSRYREPQPNPKLGVALAPHVSAMMDVSDGVLIDAARMAAASGLAACLDIGRLPLSAAFIATSSDDLEARLFAASAGDDYCLLFAASPSAENELLRIGNEHGASLCSIGTLVDGSGIKLLHKGEPMPTPEHMGFQH